MKKSPLAPSGLPEFHDIDGIEFGVAATEMKYKGRDDLFIAHFPNCAEVAGLFTTSKCPSAPVEWCRDLIEKNKSAQALMVNAGNANAFTGISGQDAMTSTITTLSEKLSCDKDGIYVASTGVIGEVLDHGLINDHVMGVNMSNNWSAAAGAILTTDTFAKGAVASFEIGDETYHLNGIAKGSGMIAPDMATMLAFLFTDAPIKGGVLQKMLKDTCDISFNNITVDSDTSTSDTVMLFATGQGDLIDDYHSPLLEEFKIKLSEVMLDLSHQIVKDGEGAQKFIEIKVTGAENKLAAKNIAMSIANSPLVKTAIAGEDANWGRIVMAVGKAGEKANRDDLTIHIGGQKVAENGLGVSDYDEGICTAHLKGQNILIEVDLAIAEGNATVWTCDLTHDYISINADYRS